MARVHHAGRTGASGLENGALTCPPEVAECGRSGCFDSLPLTRLGGGWHLPVGVLLVRAVRQSVGSTSGGVGVCDAGGVGGNYLV